MEYTLPDRLTFKRAEVIRLAKLDGKVIDYWEKEFGGFHPIANKMGEIFYSRKDVETILKIKNLLTEQRLEKNHIKKIISSLPADNTKNNDQQTISTQTTSAGTIKMIRKGLEEILTILNKNGKNSSC